MKKNSGKFRKHLLAFMLVLAMIFTPTASYAGTSENTDAEVQESVEAFTEDDDVAEETSEETEVAEEMQGDVRSTLLETENVETMVDETENETEQAAEEVQETMTEPAAETEPGIEAVGKAESETESPTEEEKQRDGAVLEEEYSEILETMEEGSTITLSSVTADTSREIDTVTITSYGQQYYDDYGLGTHLGHTGIFKLSWVYENGDTASAYSYCVQPAKDSGSGKTYRANVSTYGNSTLMAKIAYFGRAQDPKGSNAGGGTALSDKLSFWNNTDYGKTYTKAAAQWIITHIALSMTYDPDAVDNSDRWGNAKAQKAAKALIDYAKEHEIPSTNIWYKAKGAEGSTSSAWTAYYKSGTESSVPTFKAITDNDDEYLQDVCGGTGQRSRILVLHMDPNNSVTVKIPAGLKLKICYNYGDAAKNREWISKGNNAEAVTYTISGAKISEDNDTVGLFLWAPADYRKSSTTLTFNGAIDTSCICYFYKFDGDIQNQFAVYTYSVTNDTAKAKFLWTSAGIGMKKTVSTADSDYAAMVANNSAYSFEGTTYAAYETEANAKAGTNAVASWECDDEGESDIVSGLGIGTYYVKETEAGPGYRQDDTIHTLKVTSSGVNFDGTVSEYDDSRQCEFTVSDIPIYSELGVVLQKISKDKKDICDCAGAYFSFTSCRAVGDYRVSAYRTAKYAAVKTVTMKTVKSTADTYLASYDRDHKVSGTPYEVDGKYVVPLGKVMIDETKAPEGMTTEGAKHGISEDALEDGADFDIYVVQSGTGTVLRYLDEKDNASTLTAGNILIIQDEYASGTLIINKKSAVDGSCLAGAKFQLICADGTILTPASDRASELTNVSADGTITVPDEGSITVEKIPEGSYTLREIKAPAGYAINVSDVTVNIAEGEPRSVDVTDAVITIGTKAAAEDTGISLTSAKDNCKVTDEVSYTGLTVGETYTLKAQLMDKTTGEAIVLKDGTTEVSKEFTPEITDGTEKMTLTFDASAMENVTVVCFEKLYDSDDVLQAEHAELSDEDQSVRISEVKTSTKDKTTLTKISLLDEKMTVIDTVNYKNLIADGRSYTVKGKLVNKEENAEGGHDVIAESEASFTPESSDGTVDVTFTFDGVDKNLEGAALVACEYLYLEDVLVGQHEDLEDEEQTQYVPGIKTTATDKTSGIHMGKRSETTEITDHVEYTNLIPGTTYTLTGTLHYKEGGSEVTTDGKKIAAETTFTPETAEGSVDLTFTVDTSALKKTGVVVFETISADGKGVAVHADLSDENQSVYYPEISTRVSKDKTDSGKKSSRKIDADKEQKFTDTVSYSGLIPGTYQVMGTLMDKETGKALKVNGKKVTAAVTKKVTSESGTFEVPFTLDASELAGKSIVVFEQIAWIDSENAQAEPIVVGIHEDIDDEAQTMTVKEASTGETAKTTTKTTKTTSGTSQPKTGDTTDFMLLIVLLALAVVLDVSGIAMIFRKKRSGGKNE